MRFFQRRPRIDDAVYGRLMTSFGRTVDADPFIAGPATALAQRIADAEPGRIAEIDARLYRGAALYHLRLLAGSWVMAREGAIPEATAVVFEEAVAWRFEPLARGSGRLARSLSALARGEGPRDLRQD